MKMKVNKLYSLSSSSSWYYYCSIPLIIVVIIICLSIVSTIPLFLQAQTHHNINIPVNRLLQYSNTPPSDPPVAKYILLIVIILFVVVPVIALIIFGAVVFYQWLRRRNQQPQPQHPQQIQVNLSQYKIDQIGPYHSNPNDQCSICLDKQTNIRTYCGHFFHGLCLKAWYDKKTTDGRSPTCPICVGLQINPVKIYCKKCYVSGKLDVIYNQTSQQKITQLCAFLCTLCRQISIHQQSQQNSVSQNKQKGNKQQQQQQKQKQKNKKKKKITRKIQRKQTISSTSQTNDQYPHSHRNHNHNDHHNNHNYPMQSAQTLYVQNYISI